MEDNRWRCEWNADRIEVWTHHWLRWDNLGPYELLVEPFCSRCACPNIMTVSDETICFNHCEEIPGFDRVYAVGKYYSLEDRGPEQHLLSEHINKLKTNDYFARPLGMSIALVIKNRYPELLKSTRIVPMPQHPDKLTEKGFNQAEELAKVVSSNIGIEMTDILRKTRNETSTGKNRAERLKMVHGLYTMKNNSGRLNGENIILVDDILTIGDNAAECAKVLKSSGASIVNVAIAGRTA